MILDAPATILSAIVTIVALLVYFYMGFRVGSMRGKHSIKAPTMTGHPELERAVRVHMNTLEQIIVFLPFLWLATIYWHLLGWLPAAIGVLWIVGRLVYMQGYMADPDKRSMGFLLTLVATAALLVLSIWGLVVAWGAANAA